MGESFWAHDESAIKQMVNKAAVLVGIIIILSVLSNILCFKFTESRETKPVSA
jgi:hypothetical protein